MVNPKSLAQWQEAVDAAHAAITFSSARMYGLVEGGPEINDDRCMEILKAGKKQGIVPAPDAIKRFIRGMM